MTRLFFFASLFCSSILMDAPTIHLPSAPSSAEFKQMPLLVRPHRPGHVYGNIVRRRNRRGADHLLFDEATQSFQVRVPVVNVGIGPRIKTDIR